MGAESGQTLPRQDRHEAPVAQVVRNQVGGQRADAESDARRLVQHLQIVAHQACGYVDGPPARPEEHPAAAKSEGLRHEARAGREIGDLRRRPVTGEVAGRGAEDELLARQEPAGERRIGQRHRVGRRGRAARR